MNLSWTLRILTNPLLKSVRLLRLWTFACSEGQWNIFPLQLMAVCKDGSVRHAWSWTSWRVGLLCMLDSFWPSSCSRTLFMQILRCYTTISSMCQAGFVLMRKVSNLVLRPSSWSSTLRHLTPLLMAKTPPRHLQPRNLKRLLGLGICMKRLWKGDSGKPYCLIGGWILAKFLLY